MATPTKKPIRVTGVRQNNLKNFSVEFPSRKLTVITGLSGSGKSSLAFDTLYAEGQRRYIESLSTYTRQFLEKMPKPDIDSIENIPPSIALEQRNHVNNSRSTVGTQTEIIDYLRVLFAKIGHTFCTDCGNPVKKMEPILMLEHSFKWLAGEKTAIIAPISILPSPQKKKTSKASVQSYLVLLRDQGFRRIAWQKSAHTTLVLDLDDLESANFPKLPETALYTEKLFVIVDRFKMPASAKDMDKDLRSRLLDSLEQALIVGHGKAGFLNLESLKLQVLDSRFACTSCGKEHRIPEPNLFSFNSPLGACPKCSGFGYLLDLDESIVVPDPSCTLKNGAIDPLSKPSMNEWQKDMFRFAERNGISIGKRYRELTIAQKKLLWEGSPKDETFPGINKCFEQLGQYKYKLHIRVFVRRYQSQKLCPDCQGARLNRDALSIKVGKSNIAEILALSIESARAWFESLKLQGGEKKIAQEILLQLERRLEFLDAVGVGYLALSRLTKTLSGGEFQRINLATQLGNGLCGTLYVLDEPSIGLHSSDTDRLIGVLKKLRDQGNTLVVVEHDLDVMKASDWLVELGPGAGKRGGEVIAQGTAKDLAQTAGSLTGKYLDGTFDINRVRAPRAPAKKIIRITGCKENNLKNLSVDFPLERLTVVTGVSGSGKSTLVHTTFYQALRTLFPTGSAKAISKLECGQFDKLYGAEQIANVVLLDQKPIGKSSRSNPATYLHAWEEIRRIYANQVLSLRRGLTPQHFSFNVDGGRCPICKGEGEITLDMHFMAEVKLPCEECEGRRFKKNILEITYRGKNVDQLLHTTIDEAYDLFRDNSVLSRKFSILRDVGLGYLQLGQSGTTLSGGESQRLKIAAILDSQENENVLYIFDEPTTGLHQEDVKKLLYVIQDLVERRHSVIMIEHHLDVIAQADWVIDLGPGGGDKGGYLLAAGSPDVIARSPDSITGKALLNHGYKILQPHPHRELGLSP